MSNIETGSKWHKVVIWGAAILGMDCLKMMNKAGIEVVNFVDQRPPRKGSVEDIPVLQSQAFLADPNRLAGIDAVIFAMWSDSRPMREALRQMGFAGDFANFHEGMSQDGLFRQKKSLVLDKLLDMDFSPRDRALVQAIAALAPKDLPLALYGATPTTRYLLELSPELRAGVSCIIAPEAAAPLHGIPVVPLDTLSRPHAVWLTALTYLDNLDARHALDDYAGTCPLRDWESLIAELPESQWPGHAFVQQSGFHVYPLPIPPIRFEAGLDFLLLDLPARFLGMLPNGLGYVHNILKTTGCNFQTVDLDMIFYHRYHSRRLLDGNECLFAPDGRELPMDPWGVNTAEDFWYDQGCVEYFRPEIDRTVAELAKANPKILGLSLHGTNRIVATEVIRRLRELRPEMIIVVGGYDCNNPNTSPQVIADYDYMVIFEAETSLPPLVDALLAGRRHFHIPGVVVKNKLAAALGTPFAPAQLQEDIDLQGFPTYEWAEPVLYRNHNGYQLIPIILSRGCRWSRCTFCGERFHWRKRDPIKVADEIEWFVERGGRTFHFNDSDLSGDPEAVRAVCEEILRRNIRDITMMGQLRVQKGYNADYFKVLKEAGFGRLRFGIDSWAKNTLKLQKKGYTLGMIEEVLSYTKSAGIHVGINLVIGIPGETEADIDETIENIIRNRDRFDLIENLNTLILTTASVYWTDPEKFGIVLHESKEELERQHPVAIPSSLWHSTGPYIDQDVRRDRLERILDATAEYDINIGGYAERRAKRLLQDELPHDELNKSFQHS
jgi:radical SAM superfamily enzyme YgiQ (UPF0313 family)